jgi:hypothetical protein
MMKTSDQVKSMYFKAGLSIFLKKCASFEVVFEAEGAA